MRVKADYDLCQGHGVCVDEAPDVFALDESTGRYPRVVILQEQPAPELRPGIDLAVKHCPTRALKIVDDD